MPDYPTSPEVLAGVERIVVASVAVTARALGDVAPELTLAQWRVLVLVDEPDGLAVGAIASALGGKIAAVSRLVGRLETRGLVASKRADRDARVVLVSLTPAGEALRNRVVDRRRGELARGLDSAHLPPSAVQVIDSVAAVLDAAQ